MNMAISVTAGGGFREHIGKGVAFLDPEVMKAERLAVDEIAGIACSTSKSVVARVVALPSEQAGPGNNRLGSLPSSNYQGSTWPRREYQEDCCQKQSAAHLSLP